jgi:hypothetical protein
MKNIIWILCSLILLTGEDLYALSIEIDKCYSIDGPANVRETPNGKIVRSLPYGQNVRVKETQTSWVLIEYSRKVKFSCTPEADSMSGWTHEKNLRPSAQSLKNLVKDGKVLITSEKNLNFFGDERGKLLGEKLIFKDEEQDQREDMFGVAVPEHPLIVNVYCLDGKYYENEILSAEYDMGGDSGVRSVKINTKYKLPNEHCIFVNGILKSDNCKQTVASVPNTIHFCDEKDDSEFYYCNSYKGNFNKDDSFEILVNNGKHGAPWYSRWTIFQQDCDGNIKELGKIGQDGGP